MAAWNRGESRIGRTTRTLGERPRHRRDFAQLTTNNAFPDILSMHASRWCAGAPNGGAAARAPAYRPTHARPALRAQVALPDATLITALFECICALPTLPEASEALVSVLRCTQCRAAAGRRLQQHLHTHSALSAVLHALRTALATTQNQQHQQQQGCPPWLPPLTAALSLLVVGAPPGALMEMAADGWTLLKSGESAPRALLLERRGRATKRCRWTPGRWHQRLGLPLMLRGAYVGPQLCARL